MAAPDADRCTFDFREASRLHFKKEDPNAPNVVKSTTGFGHVCFKPDGTFLPDVRNVPLLQQVQPVSFARASQN